MKREFLTNLGITDKEIIDKILNEHGADINNLKSELESMKTQTEHLEGQLAERDNQLKELGKAAKDNDDLTKQIEELTATNQTAKADFEKQLLDMKINSAVELALRDAKAKNIDATKALLDYNKFSVKDDQVIGLIEQVNDLQKGENTAFLFDTEKPVLTGTKPVETKATPAPQGNQGGFAGAVANYFNKK